MAMPKRGGVAESGSSFRNGEAVEYDEGRSCAGMQESNKKETKLMDLSSRLSRSTAWGSHSAPSSPRSDSPRTQDQHQIQNIPFPLTPHPRQRPASVFRREISRIRNGLDIKLDLGVVQRQRDAAEPTETQLRRDKFAYFDKECSRVAEHIYLGSDAVAKNKETLLANQITHVLNCVGFVCPECFPGDFKYKTLWLQDTPGEDITSILYDVFDYFEEVRDMGGRVFVHCCQGISRSTSLVIAYLMWRKSRSFEDAFQDVKAARGVTNPNMGFACQLLQCQKRVHAAPVSPGSVLRMYRMAPHSPYDPLHLVPKTVSIPGAAALDSRGAFVVHVPSAIYIWIGKCCAEGMESAARTAAMQVVNYERAQGPIITAFEGSEPADFWEAFSHGCGSGECSDANSVTSTKTQMDPAATQRLGQGSDLEMGHSQEKSLPHCVQNKKNPSKEADYASEIELAPHAHENLQKLGGAVRVLKDYDVDYDVYRIALQGGIVPPSTGRVTRVPARDSGWTRLRNRVLSGCVRAILTAEATSSESSKQTLDLTNSMAFEEFLGARNPLSFSMDSRISADSSAGLNELVGSSIPSTCNLYSNVSAKCMSSSSINISNDSMGSHVDIPPSEPCSTALIFSFRTPLQTNSSINQLDPTLPPKPPPVSLAQRRGSARPSLRLSALVEESSSPKLSSKSLSLSSLPTAGESQDAPLK